VAKLEDASAEGGDLEHPLVQGCLRCCVEEVVVIVPLQTRQKRLCLEGMGTSCIGAKVQACSSPG
jgi:hypothetical protein